MGASKWTDDDRRALQEGLAAGRTVTQMAAAFGRPMTTVASFVRRCNATNKPIWTPPEANAPEPPRKPTRKDKPPVAPVVEATTPAPQPLPSKPVVLRYPVRLCDRTGCAWPVDGDGADMLFCNEVRTPGTAYCAEHARRGINPAALRAKTTKSREFRLTALGAVHR